MKKVKPIIETEPLTVTRPSYDYSYVNFEGSSFICRDATKWLNSKAKSGCRFAVFKQRVKGSRRVFLSVGAGLCNCCVYWAKSINRAKPLNRASSDPVWSGMGRFLLGKSWAGESSNPLNLTTTPEPFYVRLK